MTVNKLGLTRLPYRPCTNSVRERLKSNIVSNVMHQKGKHFIIRGNLNDLHLNKQSSCLGVIIGSYLMYFTLYMYM